MHQKNLSDFTTSNFEVTKKCYATFLLMDRLHAISDKAVTDLFSIFAVLWRFHGLIYYRRILLNKPFIEFWQQIIECDIFQS